MGDGDLILVRTGPRRRSYLLAAGVWVGGLVVAFAIVYAIQFGFNEDAAGFARAPLGSTQIEVTESGVNTVYAERVSDGSVDGAASGAGSTDVGVNVLTAQGQEVPLRRISGQDYQLSLQGQAIDGEATFEMDVPAGLYEVSVLSGDPAFVGVSVGPPGSVASASLALVAAAVGVLGLIAIFVIFRRRSRAADNLMSAVDPS